MIDINKIRNNYQKFSVIKQKCDPVVSKPQTSSQKQHSHSQSHSSSKISNNLNVTSKDVSAKNKPATATAITSNKNLSKNSVRAANHKYFLLPNYQDKEFLREECELAHAQVSTEVNKVNASKKLNDNQRNNNNCSSTKSLLKGSLKTQLSRSAPAALPLTNGMRRSTNTSVTVTNLTSCNGSSNHMAATSLNKIDISLKPLQKSTKNTTSHRPLLSQVRPLVHRTIPSTIVASSTISENKVNNNHKDLGINNNMQQSNSTSDHDDIKFIDCDEVSGPATSHNTTISGPQKCCLHQTITHSNGSVLSKTKVRPKSSIFSSNNFVFEKINNYKYEPESGGNELSSNNLSNVKNISKATGLVTPSHKNETKPSGIDPQSIKASIAKFNSLSEQKRLPPLSSTVTMRSNPNSGSINNLQNHRHSTELDSCNNRLFNSSGGSGSLTRSPYRSTANTSMVSGGSTSAATTKALNNIQSIASNVSPSSSGMGGTKNSNSLPLKSNKNFDGSLRQLEYTTGSLSKDIRTQAVLNAKAAASGFKHSDRDSFKTATDESIRDTVRSTLPPSPTSTKYWDRDSSRYSAISNHNDTETKNSHSDKRDGLCGLRNIGNTCFMNSVIQCLSHTTELTRFLRSYSATRTSTKDQNILNEFAKLIRDMWSGNTTSVTPSDLKRAFSAKHRMYSDYNQQDAQEFLRFFLDSLHSALNSGVKGEVLRIDDHLSDNAKAEQTWEWYTRIENSLVKDLFVGQLKSTLRCTTCGNTSVTFDPFWDLSVPLPTSSRCKLDSCLDLFIREEVLDGDEMPTCSKCKTRRKCTKSFSIQRFPKYLVIHLKRFSEARWSKLTNIVEFPTGERELNMAPYASNSSSSIYYSLYGVSNHMGSTAGGHYVAICKHPISKKWHEFNDNIVSGSVPETQIVSSSAYILFYERS